MAASVLGAQLFTLRDHTKTPDEIRRTIGRVREMGYVAVQASGLGPFFSVLEVNVVEAGSRRA